jgi:argininosuccinate synthase
MAADRISREVVTFTADLGQGEELEPARRKAELLGIKPENIFIEDLREEFVRDYVFPMFRANTVYEGQYLLGTSIARPLIAKRRSRSRARSAPTRSATAPPARATTRSASSSAIMRWSPTSASSRPGANGTCQPRAAHRFAEQHQIPISKDKRGEAPFSIDANLLHSSSEGRCWRTRRRSAGICPPAHHLARGRAGQADRHRDRLRARRSGRDRRRALSPAALLTRLNELGHDNGIGRLDLVENRFVGMKSRGVYETPGGTILLAAHRGIESITLDRGAACISRTSSCRATRAHL